MYSPLKFVCKVMPIIHFIRWNNLTFLKGGVQMDQRGSTSGCTPRRVKVALCQFYPPGSPFQGGVQTECYTWLAPAGFLFELLN